MKQKKVPRPDRPVNLNSYRAQKLLEATLVNTGADRGIVDVRNVGGITCQLKQPNKLLVRTESFYGDFTFTLPCSNLSGAKITSIDEKFVKVELSDGTTLIADLEKETVRTPIA